MQFATKNLIVMLVGPKGAGKTHLATRLQKEVGIPFLRVEPIWLQLRSEMQPDCLEYDREGQSRVLTSLIDLLNQKGCVVLESTGTAPWFGGFLGNLHAFGTVAIIRVTAPPATCLERVRTRCASEHIPISDERVAEINRIAEKVSLPWTDTVDTASDDDTCAFIARIQSLLLT